MQMLQKSLLQVLQLMQRLQIRMVNSISQPILCLLMLDLKIRTARLYVFLGDTRCKIEGAQFIAPAWRDDSCSWAQFIAPLQIIWNVAAKPVTTDATDANVTNTTAS
jgi:hypothetical protein